MFKPKPIVLTGVDLRNNGVSVVATPTKNKLLNGKTEKIKNCRWWYFRNAKSFIWVIVTKKIKTFTKELGKIDKILRLKKQRNYFFI